MQNEPLIRQNHDVQLPLYPTYAPAERRISRTYLFIKRIMDIALSTIGLILCIPLFIAVAIAIKLDSPGPVIFKQERVGKDGKLFMLYKFRSMRQDAEKDGPKWADKEDDRVTRVGKFIRRTRLDEIPQFWNVLKGDMSFIGPRPEVPFFVKKFEREIPGFSNRLVVKPGITGWAQVNGGYDLSPEEKLDLDMYYIENISLWMELYILFKTAKIVLTGDGAR